MDTKTNKQIDKYCGIIYLTCCKFNNCFVFGKNTLVLCKNKL